jgi:hypothetical protein
MATLQQVPRADGISVNGSIGVSAGEHARTEVHLSMPPGEPHVISMLDSEVEMPYISLFFERLLAAVAAGSTLFLIRDHRRIAAIMPADMAESLLRCQPGEDEDELDDPVEPDAHLVEDPAELRGEPMPNFDRFLASVLSRRPQ